MQCEAYDEADRGDRLNEDARTAARSSPLRLPGIPTFHHLAHRVGQPRTVAEPACPFEQDGHGESDDDDGNRYRCDVDEELPEIPSDGLPDQQILRFPDEGRDASEGGTDHRVHHEAPQEGPERLQIVGVPGVYESVVVVVVVVIEPAAGDER